MASTNLRVWMLLAAVGCVLLLTTRQAQGACSSWGYDATQPNGPQHWGDICDAYKTCSAGNLQSPIDVRYIVQDHNMGPVSFDISTIYEDDESPTGQVTVTYTGHALKMDWVPGSTMTGGPFEHVVYYLTYLTFHAPSEFTFRDERRPLSLYLYHHTSRKQVGVAVINFNQTETSSPFLKSLIPHIPRNYTSSLVPRPFPDLSELIKEAFSEGYFSFSGSLTAPPCTEDVNWIIARKSVSASQEDIAAFTSILQNNIRPIQDLNARRIKAFIPLELNSNDGLGKQAGWIFVGIVVAGIVGFMAVYWVFANKKKHVSHDTHLMT